MTFAIPTVAILLGVVVLTNVRNYPRIYFEAVRKTYSEMGNHWWNRASRTNMEPWAWMPFSLFRLLLGGALVVGGLIGLIHAL
jgi:hypothetical protein